MQKEKQNGFCLSLNTYSAILKWKINSFIKNLNILGEWKWLLCDTLGTDVKRQILYKSDQTRKWQLNLKHVHNALKSES